MSIESRRETQLHPKLQEICQNVYYEPPASVSLSYPAIIYSRDSDDSRYADDSTYIQRIRYTVAIITSSACDTYIEEMKAKFPYVRFDRHYTHDNLHHNVFTLFF